MLGNVNDAEDAVQESFTRVAARLDDMDGEWTGYVGTVARNVCRDELRRRRTAAAPAMQSAAPLPDAEAEAMHRYVLDGVLREATHEDRQLFSFAFSGLSLHEMSTRLGMSVDAVAQRLTRARRRARAASTRPGGAAGPSVGVSPRWWLVRRLQTLHAAAGRIGGNPHHADGL